MIRVLLITSLTAILLGGCSSSEPKSGTTASVPATDVTEKMVGQWGSNDEVWLVLSLQGDRIVISSPPNEAWRTDTSDAEIVDDSILFVQKSHLHSGEFHPFNGVACNSVLKSIGEDKLEQVMTSEHTQEMEPEILTRID